MILVLFCQCSCRNRSVLLTFGSWTSSQIRGPMNLGNYIRIFMVVCLSGEETLYWKHSRGKKWKFLPQGAYHLVRNREGIRQ